MGEGEEEAVDMKPATVRRLYIAALCCGLVAALLMTFVPPSVTRYTKEGSGFLNLLNEPTTTGRTRGQIQWVLSYLGPLLLFVSFGLQLVALVFARPSDKT
jgi:hypothetical protein